MRQPPTTDFAAIPLARAAELASLVHHRWAIQVIACLHNQRGAKFVTLANQLGISRDSLRRTLESLREGGFVARNPGYGHPLRPEYILTARGVPLGEPATKLAVELERAGVDGASLRKWSFPVMLVLASGRDRFSEVDAALPEATPRAITQALKGLENAGLVERSVEPGYPPRPRYRNSTRTRAIIPVLAALARAA